MPKISSNMKWRMWINGSYSVSDIQDHFKYILKTHETVTGNPSIIIYVNKIENRITFKILRFISWSMVYWSKF